MDLLTAIKREERKIEKQLGKLQHDLNRVRAAANQQSHSEKMGRVQRAGQKASKIVQDFVLVQFPTIPRFSGLSDSEVENSFRIARPGHSVLCDRIN